MADSSRGVVVPLVDGKRSSTALSRAVVTAALAGSDVVGSRAAERETDWRRGYPEHFRRLVEAGLLSEDAAVDIARRGLAEVHARMRYLGPETVDPGAAAPDSRAADSRAAGEREAGSADQSADAGEVTIAEAVAAEPTWQLSTAVVTGGAEPETELTIPHRGKRLAGDELHAQLDAWVAAGSMEPSAADAVREVMRHPEWLSLPGRTMVVLGASSEMGPLQSLLRWGATVAAVDLPNRDLWRDTLTLASRAAGTLLVPVAGGTRRSPDGDASASSADEATPPNADHAPPLNAADAGSPNAGVAASGDLDRTDQRQNPQSSARRPKSEGPIEDRAGIDLLHDLAGVARWVDELDGPLVLGNYVYADGVTNLRLSAAVDGLTTWLAQRRADLALAWLATPTDVFGVPGEVVEFSDHAYRAKKAARALRPMARLLSGGRLLRRNYVPGSEPGLNDSMVLQQGPNYLLAKRIQRWRATVARRDGHQVSMLVAPPTRTRSVLKNRALAAAYTGAHRFGVEVFAPATSSTLMAALLVHDLYAGKPQLQIPWREEAAKAVHGGLWRGPYDPRSALGIAVVLGIGRAKS